MKYEIRDFSALTPDNFPRFFVFLYFQPQSRYSRTQIRRRKRRRLPAVVFTTEGFLEVAIESWPEWDLNPRPLNSVQTL